ncbi:MAG: YopX family protein [Prevotellaceae bacterium]|jgi:uncharacterized phage protein (TIGR01671 family)|nr:YopX family protein [Prevotellaceae bacterium]
MNRQIKFRGKRTDNGEWVFGYLVHDCVIRQRGIAVGTNNMSCECEVSCSGCRVIPETVGQFTGLYDKNGKEIYEGDILDYPHREVRDCNVVTYEEWGFMLTHGDGGRFLPYNSEIIGNITDNQDLPTAK